jgi:hypothetical protein
MHRYSLFLLSAFVAVSIICCGCAGEQNQTENETAQQAEPSKEETNQLAIELWNDEVTWFETWDLIPGTTELHESHENPHGKFGSVFGNELAVATVEHGSKVMPEGAIIARENFNDRKELLRITVMLKRDGEWFWVVYSPDGVVELAGKLNKCMECHSKALNDKVYFWNYD